MSERKWTPGPWRVGHLVSYDGISGAPFRCVYRSNQETAQTRLYVWGADRVGESNVEFDCDADARLIAAAPALYDSAEEVEGILKFIFEDGALSEEVANGLAINPHGVLHDLRAALALAREPSNPGATKP